MHIRVMVFPGAHNLPLWAMTNPDIQFITCASRDEQIAAIQTRQVDVIHTAPDNLRLPDAVGLVPFLAGSVGPLHLVRAYPDDPARLGVDNPESGFGLLAVRWLQTEMPRCQFGVIAVGGTRERYHALREGTVTMAVMHPPFTEWCQDHGDEILGRVDAPGTPTLVGVCQGDQLQQPWVETYRECYRQALARLAAADGAELARTLLEQHLHLAPTTSVSIATALRTAVQAAGIEPTAIND